MKLYMTVIIRSRDKTEAAALVVLTFSLSMKEMFVEVN